MIVVILLVLLTTAIVVIAIQLLGRLFTQRKSKHNYPFSPPSDLRGMGAWNLGAPDTAEQLNASIVEGRARSRHTRPSRHRKHHSRSLSPSISLSPAFGPARVALMCSEPCIEVPARLQE
jgi:hypothetical protein